MSITALLFTFINNVPFRAPGTGPQGHLSVINVTFSHFYVPFLQECSKPRLFPPDSSRMALKPITALFAINAPFCHFCQKPLQTGPNLAVLSGNVSFSSFSGNKVKTAQNAMSLTEGTTNFPEYWEIHCVFRFWALFVVPGPGQKPDIPESPFWPN